VFIIAKSLTMSMRIGLPLFLAAVASQSFSQGQNNDSLMRVALAAPFDSTRVLLLNDVATALRELDNNLALRYAKEAKELAAKLGFRRGMGYVLENIGWIYYRKGNYSKAKEISMEALQINQKFGDKKETAQCLNNLGAINAEQELYPIGIDNFKEAYRLAKEVGNKEIMSRSLNNVAYTFLKMRQLDSAWYYTQRSMDEHINDKYRTAFAQQIVGDIAFEKGDFSSALKSLEVCLMGANEMNNNFLRTSTLYRLGRVNLQLNNPDQALIYLNQNLPIAQRFEYKIELEQTYKFLSAAYATKKDFAHAFEFQSRYQAMHDSLTEQKSGEQIALIQAKYGSEIKNTQIELLTKNSKMQRAWIYIVIGWLFLLLVLVVILVYNNRRGRMVNRLLAEKNNLINEQTQQLIGLNSTKDKLFSIIGHDMRSPVASLRGLMDLVSSTAMTQDEFVEMSKKLRKNLDHVHADLENLLSWAQTQQKGLTPTFENILLYDAVKDKIILHNETAKAKGIEVVNAVDKDIYVHADKNHLGLVFRNLIGNAIKFTHPRGSIKINCSEEGNKIKISVTDTGTGMSKEELNKLFNSGSHFSKPGTQNEKGIGLGLMLVKEFIELNNGTIEVASEEGKGTTFTFFLQSAA
jgi:two-component system, sensor histidine kinase and response regulator